VNVESPVGAFAKLAIADHVDAGISLLPHDFGNGFREADFKGGCVVRLAVLDGAPEFDEFRRPDQTADVGGQNAINVVRHGNLPGYVVLDEW
jgi:hypothetical protein